MPAPRVALITGASRGIGRAIAHGLASAGYAVAITGTDTDALAMVADEIVDLGGSSATVIACDLAEPGAPYRLHDAVVTALGSLDVLVNNAARGASANLAPVISFDDEAWERTIHLNVTVPYQLAKAALPSMIEARWGRIINIASIHADVPLARGVAYTASKHALVGLTRTIALETARDGVTANAICPGPVRTRMAGVRLAYEAERLGLDPAEIVERMTPLGRLLEPEEIAPLAVYLASDAAAGVTGQSYTIGG